MGGTIETQEEKFPRKSFHCLLWESALELSLGKEKREDKEFFSTCQIYLGEGTRAEEQMVEMVGCQDVFVEVSGERLKREGWEAKDCLRLVCLDEKGSLPPITG